MKSTVIIVVAISIAAAAIINYMPKTTANTELTNTIKEMVDLHIDQSIGQRIEKIIEHKMYKLESKYARLEWDDSPIDNDLRCVPVGIHGCCTK